MKRRPPAGAAEAEFLATGALAITEAAIGEDLGTVYTLDNHENRVTTP